MRKFCEESVKKPFRSKYNPNNHSIWIDRPVKRTWDIPLAKDA